jgi:polar amino acid transport system permease protein
MNTLLSHIKIIWENLPFLMDGLKMTILLSLITIAISFFIGVLLALLKLSKRRLISYPTTVYIEVVRATPLIMVIFWVFFLIPLLIHRPVTPITSALIAFIGFNCTYLAEIVRAGILSIPKGQMEAATVTGLTYPQAMTYIILPQALKNMIPALISRFVATFKSTSLAYIIGTIEFFRAAVIVNNREFISYEIFAFVAIVYFLCCYGMSLASGWVEKKLAVRQLESRAIVGGV